MIRKGKEHSTSSTAARVIKSKLISERTRDAPLSSCLASLDAVGWLAVKVAGPRCCCFWCCSSVRTEVTVCSCVYHVPLVVGGLVGGRGPAVR